MRKLRTRLLLVGAEAAVILGLHALLEHWLAQSQAAAVILSTGAVLFIAIRLLAMLVLPALVLAQLGGVAYDYVLRQK